MLNRSPHPHNQEQTLARGRLLLSPLLALLAAGLAAGCGDDDDLPRADGPITRDQGAVIDAGVDASTSDSELGLGDALADSADAGTADLADGATADAADAGADAADLGTDQQVDQQVSDGAVDAPADAEADIDVAELQRLRRLAVAIVRERTSFPAPVSGLNLRRFCNNDCSAISDINLRAFCEGRCSDINNETRLRRACEGSCSSPLSGALWSFCLGSCSGISDADLRRFCSGLACGTISDTTLRHFCSGTCSLIPL